jgi:hypothetical protein
VGNKKRFELKVLSVLLNAFGLSFREKNLRLLWSTLRTVSKLSVVEEWARRVEVKLSFDPNPREYRSGGLVVKCGAVRDSTTIRVGCD